MNVNSTVFLCGYFSTIRPFSSESIPEGWEVVEEDKKRTADFRNYYYSEFVDFFTRKVLICRKAVNKDISVLIHKRESEPGQERALISNGIRIQDLVLYQMPMNITLFSMCMEFADLKHQDYIDILDQLRNCGGYNNDRDGDFFKWAVSPIFEAYKQCGGAEELDLSPDGRCAYPFLVEHGNKFKVFQIALAEGGQFPEDAIALRNYVYCLGSLTKAKGYTPVDNEETYIESVSKDNYISVFKEWKALALLDSITIYARNPKDWQKTIWKDVYFGRIYIYELFRKVFLYRLNCDFHSSLMSRKPKKLQEDMRVFEQNYDFDNFSYNFMPKLFDSAIESALESKGEEAIINHLINRDIANEDEKREAKTNHLLLFLSILTVFSAIWDLFSYVKDYKECGVQWWPTLITLGVIALFITVFILVTRRGK